MNRRIGTPDSSGSLRYGSDRFPMRDGLRLFTRVYVPKDDSQPWPILLLRTPYALKPYGADNYTDPSGSFETLAKGTFILVTQDVRGRFGSVGEFVHVRSAPVVSRLQSVNPPASLAGGRR